MKLFVPLIFFKPDKPKLPELYSVNLVMVFRVTLAKPGVADGNIFKDTVSLTFLLFSFGYCSVPILLLAMFG